MPAGWFSSVTGISCPVLNSISVQTIAASDSDISVLPLWEKPTINSKVPTLLVSLPRYTPPLEPEEKHMRVKELRMIHDHLLVLGGEKTGRVCVADCKLGHHDRTDNVRPARKYSHRTETECWNADAELAAESKRERRLMYIRVYICIFQRSFPAREGLCYKYLLCCTSADGYIVDSEDKFKCL